MNSRNFNIGHWKSASHKTLIIAEAGVNHNGNMELAKELIMAAKKAGADAVKFQSFKAEWMCLKSLQETKRIKHIAGSQSAYDMYKALELSDHAHKVLFDFAKKNKMVCFSSAFDPRTVPFLKSIGSPAIKIASSDLNYKALIKESIKSALPLLISTGLSNYSEVLKVYEYVSKHNVPFALLYCIASYPAKSDENDLNVIKTWSRHLNCVVGFSDHSLGTHLPIAAVALGARIIEKHFTLDQHMPGPDQALSVPPDAFKTMVEHIRDTEHATKGQGYKTCTPSEQKSLFASRRGIKAAHDLKKGSVLKESDLSTIKPATGISPWDMEEVIGKRLTEPLKRGEAVEWGHLK